jgi:hypothetical protein
MLRLPLLALVLCSALAAPAQAQAVAAPVDSQCLSAAAIQEALADGKTLRLADVRRKLAGDIVKADLCRRSGKLAYIVTVLTPTGMVKRVTIDASSGEMMYDK